jgi:hypothetical protein
MTDDTTTLEQRLETALHQADQYEPSADLFAKVIRSIEEDAAHRRRVRLVLASIATTIVAIGAFVALTARTVDGHLEMPFAALEGLTIAVLIGLVVVLGPAIRRFGQTYEATAFGVAPETGRRVLRLLDIAYYLIFAGFILITTHFAPPAGWGPPRRLGSWVHHELERVGGFLLLMGVLHVALLLALPIVGLVLTSNWRRDRRAEAGDSAPPANPWAERVDKFITVFAWVLAGLVLLNLLQLALGLVVGLGGP